MFPEQSAMTEGEASSVVFVHAIESGPAPGWSDADATWASDEARRVVGERAAFEVWLAQRARLACARIAQRDFLPAVLRPLARRPFWMLGAVLIAFVTGVASDVVGSAQRINILAPPLLALLVWNVAVYVLLVLRYLTNRVPHAAANGPLRQALSALVRRIGAPARDRPRSHRNEALRRFATEWGNAARNLYGWRVATALHAGAAALVLGALLSLYVRGLAFEYRAGWESTFLTPPDVHAFVAAVLGPAAKLSGISLPSVDQIAASRLPAGSGENAARWIHLYAITLTLVVVLPRALLAAAAAWRAHTIARSFPLALDDAYFRRLRHVWSGNRIAVRVLPYSYTLDEARRRTLRAILEKVVAPGVEPAFSDPVLFGNEDAAALLSGFDRAEDAATRHAASDPAEASIVVALFALTATPEREQHGAFVQALAERAGRDRVLVIVDESGFRQRFGDADAGARLAQRRASWESMLQEAAKPLFVDLSAALAASDDHLAAASFPAPHARARL